MEKLGVLNISLARYRAPLDEVQKKKYEGLSEIADLYVVGFSRNLRFRRLREPVRLDLLPPLPPAGVRFALLFLYTLVVGYRLSREGRIQAVLSQGPHEGFAGVVLRRLMRLRGRRLVLITELHGDWESSPFLYQRIPPAAPFRRLVSRWGTFVLKRSDVIRAVSAYLERKATVAAAEVPRIVFPAFTDYELFRAAPGPNEDAREEPIVLFVGALVPVKGVSTLLRAMKRVIVSEPQARLHILGDGPLRSRLEKEVAESGLEKSVSFLGERSQRDVLRELMRSRVVVLPSLSEGLGLAAVEAMSCGLPVVASAVGGLPELVRDGETGFLVTPGDETALADRLGWILRHRQAADEMGRQGRALVEENFSARRYFEGYAQLFRKAKELI